MNIDVRVGENRIQYAGQWEGLHPDVRAVIEEGFTGDETDDFYEGMLAGLSFAFVIQQQMPESVNVLTGAAIAYISGGGHKE
jgi:hypothetical protein